MRIFLVLTLVMSFASFAFSQQDTKRLALGLNAAYQNSWINDSGNAAIGPGYLPGVQAGLKFQYMTRPMLGFETILQYSQNGWREATTAGIFERNINTLEWQLNTHISIGKSWLRLLLDAGPYLRFFLDDKFNGPTSEYQYEMTLHNNTQYGLNFSGGLGFRFENFIIQGKGFFNLGLTNYFNSNINFFLLSSERVAGGSLSIMIPFGKTL